MFGFKKKKNIYIYINKGNRSFFLFTNVHNIQTWIHVINIHTLYFGKFANFSNFQIILIFTRCFVTLEQKILFPFWLKVWIFTRRSKISRHEWETDSEKKKEKERKKMGQKCFAFRWCLVYKVVSKYYTHNNHS